MGEFKKLFEETVNEFSNPRTKRGRVKLRKKEGTDGWEPVDKSKSDTLRYDDGKSLRIDVSKRNNEYTVIIIKGGAHDNVKNTVIESFKDIKKVESFISKETSVGMNKKKFEEFFK